MSRINRGLCALVLAPVLALAAFACASSPAFAAGVTADVTMQLNGSYQGSNALGAPVFSFNQKAYTKFVEGTASSTSPSQTDKMYAATRTLTASSSEDLDLAGTLTDPFGVTLTCVKVKAIYFKASANNTNSVVVGNAASNQFVGPFGAATHTVALPPGGGFAMTAPSAGWTVTATTGDLLHVANSGAGTSVTYDVIVLCTSA